MKYAITTAQAEAKPISGFLRTLDNVVNETLILPTIGKSAKQEKLHDNLYHYCVVEDEPKLNNNIGIMQTQVRPYQLDPSTGQGRLLDQTSVSASPKQRVKSIPTSNNRIPKFFVTTGACTHPNYANGADSNAERRRLGKIALKDHIVGGLLVDILDDEKYVMRHVRSTKQGRFIDLGYMYNREDTPVRVKPKYMIFGDTHSPITDSKAKKAGYEMIEQLEPENGVFHDFTNFHTVCPHNAGKIAYLAQYADMYDNWNLESELARSYEDLIEYAGCFNKMYLVWSNHSPEFLLRWLNDLKFREDPQNVKLGSKLYAAMVSGKNPWKVGFELAGGPVPDNVVFLDKFQDLKYMGWKLDEHGHRGANGSRRGSHKSREEDMSKVIHGHDHKYEMKRNIISTGCNAPLQQPWMNGGPNAMVHANTALYHNGVPQTHLIIDGVWKAD